MSNTRWRKINQFLAVSEIGKKQSAFGTYLADADLDYKENCTIEHDIEIEYGQELNCEQRDLIGEPVERRLRRFRFVFSNPTAQTIWRWVCYKEGSTTAPTGTPADEVQTLTRSGTVSGGTFPLALSLEGRSGASQQIAYDATAAQIQAALTNAAYSIGKINKSGDVVVSGNWTSGIAVTFGGRLAKANIPLMTVDNTNITGGGSVAIAQTTAGANKYHTAQRTADGSLALFSFATGDKNESVAHEKYGDAAVESIEFALDTEQTNVTMTVVVLAAFNPQETSSFTVPDCVNAPGVKVTDCRLNINSNWEHRDLVNLGGNFSNNIPVAASFCFDDMDVSEAWMCGDRPTQGFTAEIYGNREHSLAVLASNAHVEGNEVPFVLYLGNPGNRVIITGAETKIKPNGQLEGFSGEANQSTIRLTGTPYGITDVPVSFEAYLDETSQFLTT